MKLTVLTLFLASIASANPFTSFINWVRNDPKGVNGCVIENRDFARGPVVDKSDWNKPCILEAQITTLQLANVKDTAEFLNARKEFANRPTKAVWINTLTGTRSPMNSQQMIEKSKAEALVNKLKGFGCLQELQLIEPRNAFSVPDYGDETRRHYYIGTINLGLVNDAYVYPVEVADQRVKAEIGECK